MSTTHGGKDTSLDGQVDAVLRSVPSDVTWGICVLRNGVQVARVAPEVPLRSASMGKVFLLAETSRRLRAGDIRRTDRLRPEEDDLVTDSGLLQFLGEAEPTIESLCVLIGSVSDNLATNVLLRRIGLESVQALSSELGIPETRMTDRIRDSRGPGDPEGPSQARAADLSTVMFDIATRTFVSPQVSEDLEGWLALNADLSMVSSAFGLDPLAHTVSSGGPRFFNKTGTDAGVRSDAGCIEGVGGCLAFAVTANWPANGPSRSDDVLLAMNRIGQIIRDSAQRAQ